MGLLPAPATAYLAGLMIDALYSDRILRLAANLPHSGRLDAPQGSAERVAKLCGSVAIVDIDLDADGRVVRFAQDVKACALGQATASIMGSAILGASLEELDQAVEQMRAMLKDGGPAPSGRFADLALLAVVRDYPARHASTLIPLEAAATAARLARDRTTLAGAA